METNPEKLISASYEAILATWYDNGIQATFLAKHRLILDNVKHFLTESDDAYPNRFAEYELTIIVKVSSLV